MLNVRPQNTRDAKRNTNAVAPLSRLTPEPIPHALAGPGSRVQPTTV